MSSVREWPWMGPVFVSMAAGGPLQSAGRGSGANTNHRERVCAPRRSATAPGEASGGRSPRRAPWVVWPVNVYDLNQPNPTGLFKGIENDLRERLQPGAGNQRKSQPSFKSLWQLSWFRTFSYAISLCSSYSLGTLLYTQAFNGQIAYWSGFNYENPPWSECTLPHFLTHWLIDREAKTNHIVKLIKKINVTHCICMWQETVHGCIGLL